MVAPEAALPCVGGPVKLEDARKQEQHLEDYSLD